MISNQKINLNSTDFVPRSNSILVEYNEPEKEETTESGILVTMHRSSLERETQGKVVAVGNEIEWINEGDIVVWAMTDGINLDMLDGKFLLLRETSIIGKKK